MKNSIQRCARVINELHACIFKNNKTRPLWKTVEAVQTAKDVLKEVMRIES